MDDSGTTGEDGRWLTYAELAELRGITRKAAIRLTQRHQWRRQPGNDGATRVFVPSDIARRQTPRDSGTPDVGFHAKSLATLEAALSALREAHAGEITALRERLDRAETAMERARADAQEALDAAEALRQAEAARKARGRWARLRAAWRG